MAKPLKVGVIGVGSLGQWHARIYSELPSVNLVGVYDADPKRAEEIAKKYKTTPFTDMGVLCDEIEAASIVVPTDLHLDVASKLMTSGVHVLVEKPIASSTSDAEVMVKLAEKHELILQVGHVERFNPVMDFLETTLDSPSYIEAERLAPYPPSRKGLPPRGTEVSVVLDLMIHDLDIIFHLVGSEVKEFHAIGVPVLSGSEDIANVRLCFENGCVANVSASRISRDRTRKIRVFQKDTYVSLNYEKQSGHIYHKDSESIKRKKVPIHKDEPLKRELEAFADTVIHRNEPVVTGQHGSRALKMAVAICEHIRQGGS